MRFLRPIGAIAFVVLVCSAHIGSPDTWYEGNAGPYHVVVQVVAPGVVPGIAKIFVRVPATEAVRVTLQINRFDAIGATPPPELAKPVAGDAGLFSGELWIMTRGSNSVTVDVSGARGAGKAVVPVGVVASRRLELDPRFGFFLAALGVFLFIGIVSIVGAAVREGSLPPGAEPDAHRRKKARLAMAGAGALAGLALMGGARWWKAEDGEFEKSLFRPLQTTVSIKVAKDQPELELQISDSLWLMRNDSSWLRQHGVSRRSPLILDHGKLMHAFMIREPDMLAFAHLHPRSADSITFNTLLPALPPGTYRVYGDIVHESGFSETVVSRITLRQPPASGLPLADSDDAIFYSTTNPNDSLGVASEGVIMRRLRSPGAFVVGVEAPLDFAITDQGGRPLKLEAYMGMPGHAVVAKDDGSVFVHLHPMGTVSMASQMAIMMRQAGDSVSGELGKRISVSGPMLAPEIPSNGVVSFPYAFPQPGRYHMWVQAKHDGRILTGAFAFNVVPAGR